MKRYELIKGHHYIIMPDQAEKFLKVAILPEDVNALCNGQPHEWTGGRFDCWSRPWAFVFDFEARDVDKAPTPEEYAKTHRMWVAMDYDGKWWAYKNKPQMEGSRWIPETPIERSHHIRSGLSLPKGITINWYESLITPEGKPFKPREKKITRFEEGHWYRCVVKERGSYWNSSGKMDGVLDGKPHKCLIGIGSEAVFDCTPRENDDTWSWSLDEFVEVPEPKVKAKFKVGDKVSFNGKDFYDWKGNRSFYFGIITNYEGDKHYNVRILPRDNGIIPLPLGSKEEWLFREEYLVEYEKLQRGDPIFVWNDEADDTIPALIMYFHSKFNKKVRVFSYMTESTVGVTWDHYRKFDPNLVGVPRKEWPKE